MFVFSNDSIILPALNVNYNCVPSHNYSTHLDVLKVLLRVDHIKIHNFERKCSLIIFFFLDIQLFFRWRITAVLANKKLWRVLCETFLKISFYRIYFTIYYPLPVDCLCLTSVTGTCTLICLNIY